MLWASEIQNDMFTRHKKIFFAAAILSGKRKFVQIGYYSLLHQAPELTRCDPRSNLSYTGFLQTCR